MQTYAWKIAAAMDTIVQGRDVAVNESVVDKAKAALACVSAPYVLLLGPANVSFGDQIFSVACENCTLTNCVGPSENGTVVMVLQQLSFVMLPVNVTGP